MVSSISTYFGSELRLASIHVEGGSNQEVVVADELKNCRIAVLVTDGFEQAELTEPVRALRQSGARVDIVSPDAGEIQGMKHKERGDKVQVDRVADQAVGDDYVAPGAGRGAQPRYAAHRSARGTSCATSSSWENRSLPRSVAGHGR